MSHADYDFFLFSRSLRDLPDVRAPHQLRQSVVVGRRAAGFFVRNEPPPGVLRGRLVRNPGLRDGSVEHRVEALFAPLPVRCEGMDILVGSGESRPLTLTDWSRGPFCPPVSRARPCVFVWPALWAVGGVERVALEVMRQLRHDFDFVVITLERVRESLGSLHHALKGLAIATYDLGEIGSPESFLSMLTTLKRAYRPSLVWICNGSPWQCDHALQIREAYADTPIVDQQVYDTRVGWIARYHEPGIQSFDRHIAINQAIRRVFVDDLHMDPERVDLIYHAFDAARFDPAAYPPARVERLRAEHGLPVDAPLFVFVGRMTGQKRPLDFVDLAGAVAASTGARFLMLGDGDLAPAVDIAIDGLLPGTVRRLPFSDRVPDLFAMTDGLVMTSEYEGLPVAMLEALAMGVPVLATDVGDIRLVLEEYSAGVVVPGAGDPLALLEAFGRFHSNLSRYRDAARAASAAIRERFAGASVAARYRESWERAVDAHSRGSRRDEW